MNNPRRRIPSLKLNATLTLAGLLLAWDPALALSSDSLNYFPCDVGDTWFYYVQYSPTQGEFRTIRVDSAVAHQLGRFLFISGDEYRSGWMILDTSKDIVYDAGLTAPDSMWLHCRYQFNGRVGDFWPQDSLPGTHLGYGVSAIFDTGVFGVERKVKTFCNILGVSGDTIYSFYGDTLTGEEAHNPINWYGTLMEDYAYGIGMTYRYVEPGEGWMLIGAIINGDSMGTILGMKEKKSDIPKQFALSQNYPNPFNPTTTIDYKLHEVSQITLKVYNVRGQEVATLFSGMRIPGQYQATFNASRFASGVYFYRLQAGSYSMTKKMLLLK